MATKSSADKSAIKRLGIFSKSVKAELKKVSWPTKKELINYTIVVFVICALLSFLVWLFDTAIGELLSLFV